MPVHILGRKDYMIVLESCVITLRFSLSIIYGPMAKKLLFASAVNAAWLAICFLVFGVLYIGIGFWIDPTGLMQFENAWGTLHYGSCISIPRILIFGFGASMFFACVPVNYYWLKRLTREKEHENT